MIEACTPSTVSNTILSNYRLGGVRECQYLSGGMFAKPLLISSDSGKFVLRAHRFRNTESSFRFQTEAMNALAARNFSCPRIIPDQFGRMGQVVGTVLWALYEYVEGSQYSWTEWVEAKRNTEFLMRIGAHVARLHDELATIKPEGNADLSPLLPPIQFPRLAKILKQWEADLDRIAHDRAVPSAPQSRCALLENASRIREHWEYLCKAVREYSVCEIDVQLVHGDISPVNMLFGATDGFGLIDWDCLHYGLRMYDALGDVLNRHPTSTAESADFSIGEVCSYLEAYQRTSSRRFTRTELNCVPALCIARQLEDLRQRVWVLSDMMPALDAEYAVLIRGRVRMLDRIRACSEELFRMLQNRLDS